jgi:hypothetical protein
VNQQKTRILQDALRIHKVELFAWSLFATGLIADEGHPDVQRIHQALVCFVVLDFKK